MLAGALAFACGTLAAPVAASPMDDYAAVRADFAADGKITHCKWSKAVLQNARTLANQNPEDGYNGFQAALDAELASTCSPSGGTGPGTGTGTGSGGGGSSGRPVVSIAVSPGTIRAGRNNLVKVRITVANAAGRRFAVPKATVRIGSRTVRTNSAGRTSAFVKPARAGTLRITARLNGFALGSKTIKVLAPLKKKPARKHR